MSEQQPVTEELEQTQADAATETASEVPAEQNLADELTAALQQIAELKDQQLRTQAEMQNIRRRADADVEKAHKFGSEKFAMEMLDVVDNLERAVAACVAEDEATQSIRQGVEMTLTGLINSLAKFKVEVVDPQNAPFNPELHQAISMVDNPEAAPNTVIAVMQKGYTLHGRILRPAMVVVSKGASQVNTQA